MNAESPRVDFDDLYRHNFDQLVRLANLLTASNSASEDVVQEAFVQLHKRLSTVENPGAYLRVTVVNLCKNWHRSRAREARRMDHVEAEPASVPPDVGEVLAVVDRLPFRQRTALVARYWLELPEAAIAELIGCRPGTVKSLTSRALDTLRKELQ